MADPPLTPPRRRRDEPHRQPPNPHMFDLPKKQEIRLLVTQLDEEEIEIPRFARRLSLFPGLNRYVLAMANFRLATPDRRINDSGHASVLLGIGGLQRLLEPLLEDESPPSKAG